MNAARVRSLKQLTRRGVRHERRLFLAEGPQAVREALGDPARVVDIYLAVGAAPRHAEIEARALALGLRVTLVDDEELAALSDTVTPQGILALCDFRDLSLDEAVATRPTLVCVLASIRDPGNAGTILRAADAAGADLVIFADETVDPYNPKTIRASAGSVFHVPFVLGVSSGDAVAALRTAGLHIVAATADAPTDLFGLDDAGELKHPTAWLFGNEAWGLPEDVRDLADSLVSVPIYGAAESLNLATAATVCLYSSARAQRR